jgi:N-methylhydantoinase B/oxoprolinase/acetone carboxylase alpha subunit
MAGGQDGSRNYIKIIRKDGREEVFGKVARLRLEKDDVVRLVTGNGGGYGDSQRRPREKVAEDVKNGYVTPEQAEDLYVYKADRPRYDATEKTGLHHLQGKEERARQDSNLRPSDS